jgi:hypothetical protein
MGWSAIAAVAAGEAEEVPAVPDPGELCEVPHAVSAIARMTTDGRSPLDQLARACLRPLRRSPAIASPSTTSPPNCSSRAGVPRHLPCSRQCIRFRSAGHGERSYPSAARVITENVDQFVAHLRFPLVHRKRTRSTNLRERTFVEVRRRTKMTGRFPGETSALSLIWAVLQLSSRAWRGVEMTPKTAAEIEHIRRRSRPARSPATATAKEIAAAYRHPQRSYVRTHLPGTWDAAVKVGSGLGVVA